MTEKLTPERIAELRELISKTTDAPWHVENPDDDMCMNAFTVVTEHGSDYLDDAANNIAITLLQSPEYANNPRYEVNAHFIAEAREALPAALDEIERLREALQELYDLAQAAIEIHETNCPAAYGFNASDVCTCGADKVLASASKALGYKSEKE